MHRTESKTSPRRIQAVFKQRQALELRTAGRTYEEIASTLGYRNHTGAVMAVQSALQKTLQVPTDQWRSLTIERLSKILEVFWPAMLKQDEKAADRVFRAISDMRQLLGLDAPVRHEVSGTVEHTHVAQLEAALARLPEEGLSRLIEGDYRVLEGGEEAVDATEG